MQGLHLSINDVKLIDLKNPRFMHSNRTPWENDDNTPWAYNSSNTRSFYPNLQHEISPSNFLNSLLKKIFWEKTTCWTNIHHGLGDSPSCFFRNSTTSHGRISRFPGHSGASPQWIMLSFFLFRKTKATKTPFCLSLSPLSLCCFFSDSFFLSILYMRHWQTM